MNKNAPKLSKEQVLQIPELLKTMRVTEVAKHFGIAAASVNRWIHRLEERGYSVPKRKRGRSKLVI